MLVRHGADVNCVSDTGSTPVRSACFMTHLEIVRLLVQYRANIQRPNFNGGTCLINSVQSVQLCEFLLEKEPGTRLVLTGDLLTKGPDPGGVVRLVGPVPQRGACSDWRRELG